MKCPKCDYLGFETGDRCKNCGYDFSLLPSLALETSEPDLTLRTPSDVDEAPRVTPWLDQLDRMFGEADPSPVHAEPVPEPPAPVAGEAAPERTLRITQATPLADAPPQPPPAFRGEPALPLFSPPSTEDDEPLVKLPATPRPPLAVRKTPDRQRLRAFTRTVPGPDAEPTLEFADAAEPPAPDVAAAPRPTAAAMATDGQTSDAAPRLTAALIDHAILFGIDFLVLYFTLRLASLPLAGWRALPPVPLVAFLAIVKVAYFAAFTAVGGQTIGKMAAGIRVITDDRGFVDPSRAMQRTLAGVVSCVTLGLAFIPALFGAEKRALHDRVAHTRVVALPSGHF